MSTLREKIITEIILEKEKRKLKGYKLDNMSSLEIEECIEKAGYTMHDVFHEKSILKEIFEIQDFEVEEVQQLLIRNNNFKNMLSGLAIKDFISDLGNPMQTLLNEALYIKDTFENSMSLFNNAFNIAKIQQFIDEFTDSTEERNNNETPTEYVEQNIQPIPNEIEVKEGDLLIPQLIDNNVLKIFTDKGTMEIYNNLSNLNGKGIIDKTPFGESVLKIKLKNGYIEVKEKNKADRLDDIIKNAKSAVPVFLFIIYEISYRKNNIFEFDLNDYFEFIGKRRNKPMIDMLEKGLNFLAHCEFNYKTKVNGKIAEGNGNLGYTIKRLYNDGSKSYTKRESIEIYAGWAEPIVMNSQTNNQFMLIDKMMPKVDNHLYPKALQTGMKLFERYKNNSRNRKGQEWEVLTVEHILCNVWGISKKEISKRKDRYISTFDRTIFYLSNIVKIFDIRYEKGNHQIPDDCFKDKIIFKPLNSYIPKMCNK